MGSQVVAEEDTLTLEIDADAMTEVLEDRFPILQHLLTYDEIRKRCDVWELFLDGQNVAHLDTGERQRELRVTTRRADPSVAEVAQRPAARVLLRGCATRSSIPTEPSCRRPAIWSTPPARSGPRADC